MGEAGAIHGAVEAPAPPSPTGNSHNNRFKTAGKTVLRSVLLSRSFKTLRDMYGEELVDSSNLKKIKVLGEGAFAVAELSELHQKDGSTAKVVVKRLKPHLLKDPDELQCFVDECKILRKLQHRNIVKFMGMGEMGSTGDSTTTFMVLEYLDGGTMKDLLQRQMLQPFRKLYALRDALAWALQVAEGLAYLHSSKPRIVHRDMKLENVFYNKMGQELLAKIGDFGLFAAVGRAAAQRSESMANPVATATGGEEDKWRMTGATGSYMYMAPEVFLEQPYNEKADVFSFAIIMFELFHRQILSTAVSQECIVQEPSQWCEKVADGYRRPISNDLPSDIQALIRDCWAQQPEGRPDMATVVACLKQIQASKELDGEQGTPAAVGVADSGGCGCCVVM